LLHDQADVLTGIVRQLNRQVDDTEDALLAGRLNHKRPSRTKAARAGQAATLTGAGTGGFIPSAAKTPALDE
jgi:hypothetical protein